MDHDSFDHLARALAALGTRRAALGALLGTGMAGTLSAAAAKKDRAKKRRTGKKAKGTAQVSAQAADCLSPGPSSNISGCNYQDEDFSGDDLSGSKMVATNFRGAELVRTNLSSANAKNAIFRDADLCGANLRSSTLGGADFRAADLRGANLKSSGGCNTATFNAATTFCGTVMCDGSVRNDDCVGGPPSLPCCSDADCSPCSICQNGGCVITVGASCPAPEGGTDDAVCQADGACCVPEGGSPGGSCNADNCCSGICIGISAVFSCV